MSLYGVGELTAVAILAELGDTRRFSSSRQAVRYAGLDITVHQSDQCRAPERSPTRKDIPETDSLTRAERQPFDTQAPRKEPTTPDTACSSAPHRVRGDRGELPRARRQPDHWPRAITRPMGSDASASRATSERPGAHGHDARLGRRLSVSISRRHAVTSAN